MKRQAAQDALEIAAALEAEGRALFAHAARLRDLAGEAVPGHASGAAANGGDRWLDATEVHGLTGLPLATIYRRGRAGELGAIRIGRSMRFSERGLREWAENGGAR